MEIKLAQKVATKSVSLMTAPVDPSALSDGELIKAILNATTEVASLVKHPDEDDSFMIVFNPKLPAALGIPFQVSETWKKKEELLPLWKSLPGKESVYD